MKKCPKCGTILDDSKKTCYMCGTDLNENSSLNFGDIFDNPNGASTNAQDNIFGAHNNLLDNSKDIIDNEDNKFFVNKNTEAFYNNEINKLNSMEHDERSGLQKNFDNIFKSKETFKSKEEVNKKNDKKKEKAQLEKEFEQQTKENKKQKNKEEQPEKEQKQTKDPIKDKKIEKEKTKETPKTDKNIEKSNYKTRAQLDQERREQKKQEALEEAASIAEAKLQKKQNINWGENLEEQTTEKYPLNANTVLNKLKSNKKLALNIFSIIIFVGILIFVAIKFIDFGPTKEVKLNGLVYSISKDFKLKNKDGSSKYYTYGENCGVRVSSGGTNDTDTYVDDYLTEVKGQYENSENITTYIEEIRINENTWHALNVVSFKGNDTNTGFENNIKYRYISVVYKANYYTIIYANPDDDETCKTMYDELITSLSFE